jgi:purine-binding chemotaxis protein CheW
MQEKNRYSIGVAQMGEERALANQSADGNDQVLQWVTFRLEQETYGINVMQV